MSSLSRHDESHKKDLVELLRGGFAPNLILLREFHFDKVGILLDGLHFSAWILLGHIHARHCDFLEFMKHPHKDTDLWPEAHWPENYQPKSHQEWEEAIASYESDLQQMMDLVADPNTDIFQQHKNGKSLSWAAMTILHHTGYHIGQLKTIGRQLGIW